MVRMTVKWLFWIGYFSGGLMIILLAWINLAWYWELLIIVSLLLPIRIWVKYIEDHRLF